MAYLDSLRHSDIAVMCDKASCGGVYTGGVWCHAARSTNAMNVIYQIRREVKIDNVRYLEKGFGNFLSDVINKHKLIT